MKTKTKNTYEVKYRVVGSMTDLTKEQLVSLAEKYIKTVARNTVLGKLNEVEPAILISQKIKADMIEAGMPVEGIEAFFKMKDYPLEVPSTFEIPIASLIPSEENTRGRKAADVFSFESSEDEDDDEADDVEAEEVE
jgi:hypothetical protein